MTRSTHALGAWPLVPARLPTPKARLALAVYWPLLALATHWPRLEVRVGGRNLLAEYYLDKLVHAAAFGLLAWLLVAAGFGRRRLTWRGVVLASGLVAALYAGLDESTQGPFHREVSIWDFAANLGGIALVTGAALWSGRRHRSIAPGVRTDNDAIPAASGPAVTEDGVEVAPSPEVEGGALPVADAPPAPAHRPHAGGFVGAAMTVSVLTFLSRITGLVRDSYLAAAFGIGAVSDAFWFGFAVPNLFRRLFGEGALTAAFIPVYTELTHEDRELARRFASLCLGLTALVLGAITIVGELALTTTLLARMWTPGTALAVRLTVIMLPYMPLVCLVAIIGSMLQVHGRFAPAAGMPIFLNVVMIAGTWLAIRFAPGSHGVPGAAGGLAAVSNPTLRYAAYVVSFSVVAAGVVQVVAQGAILLRYESFTRAFAGTRKAFLSLLKTFLPMLMALAVFQINTFFDSLIAFGLSPKEGGADKLHLFGWVLDYPVSPGGNTALQNAQRLYQFPLGVFGLAIATAIFPALSHAASSADEEGRERFRRILRQGLRLTVFIGLPASAGLVLVREPLVRLVYGWGRVTTGDYLMVARILAGYAPAIWAYSMTHVITRAFYALKDPKTPLVVSVWMVVLNLALNLVLVWPLGAAGPAWATAIAAIVQNLVLVRRLRGYMDNPVDRSVWLGWARTAVVTALMSAALLPIAWGWNTTTLTRRGTAVQLAAMVALGGAVFAGGALALRVEEIGWLRKRRGAPSA